MNKKDIKIEYSVSDDVETVLKTVKHRRTIYGGQNNYAFSVDNDHYDGKSFHELLMDEPRCFPVVILYTNNEGKEYAVVAKNCKLFY